MRGVLTLVLDREVPDLHLRELDLAFYPSDSVHNICLEVGCVRKLDVLPLRVHPEIGRARVQQDSEVYGEVSGPHAT